jgi:Xaa-Pro aminopeptidase
MKEAGMSAVVAASPHNVFHTSGSLIITHSPIRDRLAFCITTGAGHQTLVVCGIERSLCAHDSWVEDIRTYVEFQELPTALLARTLRDLGLDRTVVGLELGYLRDAYFQELRTAAPGIEFRSCDAILEESRVRKPPAQVARMRKDSQVVTAVLREAVTAARAGQSERQIRVQLRRALAERGADGSYIVVAAGPHTTIPDHRATDRVIEAGEPLILEAAATFDGYAAEGAVSAIVGRDAAEAAMVRLQAVYRATTTHLRAGIFAREVYARAAEAATPGTLVIPCVGHGVSYGGEEMPYLAAHSHDVLAPGMVLAVDVHYRYGPEVALRLKEMYAIGMDGTSQCLSSVG